MESHNWFWITSFSSHTSRSWENIEGKMRNFTSTSPEYGAKPWEQALPVFPLSSSTQWKKVLWPSSLENWWAWITVLTNNSLIKTFLNCYQLCDSFTYMPPAIPVPVRKEETTVLGLWMKCRWITALSVRLRKSIPSSLVQTSFYKGEAHKKILWWRTYSSFSACLICICIPVWNIVLNNAFKFSLCNKSHKMKEWFSNMGSWHKL